MPHLPVAAPAQKDWKRALQSILAVHNDNRAGGRKTTVSHRTRDARAAGLFRMFALLRTLGFKPAPASLGGRHVAALVRYWVADTTLLPELRARQSTAALPLLPYSAAYIQQQLSFLRVYAGWIGKDGLVLTAAAYADAALVTRRYNAAGDHGWPAAGVDPAALLAAVARIDPFVKVQLEVMMAFGLRRKEAVMFSPYLAMVPLAHLPPGAGSTRYLSFLRLKRGTKGGRLRYTAIRAPEQLTALVAATVLAGEHEGAHIGRPGRSLKQALDRFSYVLRKVGAHAVLGVTPHVLRHQFAGDLYYELTGLEAPARGASRCTTPRCGSPPTSRWRSSWGTGGRRSPAPTWVRATAAARHRRFADAAPAMRGRQRRRRWRPVAAPNSCS